MIPSREQAQRILTENPDAISREFLHLWSEIYRLISPTYLIQFSEYFNSSFIF